MQFRDVVINRRSCRAFDPAKVPSEHMEQILEAARWAPSPLNLQPWEFIVVTEPAVKRRILDAGKEAKRSVVDQSGPGWVTKYDMGFIEAAPLLVAVVYDPFKGGLGDFFGQKYGAIQAASACIENMLLAAADLGYASLWFTFFNPDKLKAVLKVPDNLDVAGLVVIGKPAVAPEAPPRKKAVVHRQHYGSEG
jgi:nitroreductase